MTATDGTQARRAAASTVRARRLDPGALAGLEDERDFLLRSLDDLERERAAGDVDDHDYEILKDDYTARAARALRAIDAHQAEVTEARSPRSWRRRVSVAAGVVAFAVLAGILVAQASGRRESGRPLSGDIRQSSRVQLAEAAGLAAAGRYDEAIEVCDGVLDVQPGNAEALAYKGWYQTLSGDSEGVDTLIAATEADPELPDTHAFLAIILSQAGRPDLALAELDRLEALDPPDEMLALVSGLRAQLEDEVSSDGAPPPTAAAPGAPP